MASPYSPPPTRVLCVENRSNCRAATYETASGKIQVATCKKNTISALTDGKKDVKCPQSGVSTEDGEPQQILGMVQCHGRDPPSLLLTSDSIKDTLEVMLQRSNQQTFC
ncbi:hypothetical protein DPX16_0628 [Anabarilius grahami]|uniref:Uncharacterized protein n=1 Tax=Anabarilius grahami TaxID=495550 RepID=A0A3N0XM43_ANAGA|nr:hypothetical protein DPX16_0628 [Anabarilius grahami]